MKKRYAYILNFETATIDCLDLVNCPENDDTKEFIEEVLDYSLSNCEWMVTNEKIEIQYLN